MGYTAIQSDITEEKNIRENLEHEIERRNKLEAELRYLSDLDALSGMANRRHFFEQADCELARCRRHVRPLSLMLFDLDDFKSVNDTRGHAAGDAVIRAVGDLCGRIQRRVVHERAERRARLPQEGKSRPVQRSHGIVSG